MQRIGNSTHPEARLTWVVQKHLLFDLISRDLSCYIDSISIKSLFPFEQMNVNESITILKALADRSRLMIINALMEKPQYVEELAERLSLAPSTVSFHLKKMESAKLVRKTRDQYYLIYELNPEVFDRTLKELTSFSDIQKFVQDERIARYRNKVLKAFFKGFAVDAPADAAQKAPHRS